MISSLLTWGRRVGLIVEGKKIGRERGGVSGAEGERGRECEEKDREREKQK